MVNLVPRTKQLGLLITGTGSAVSGGTVWLLFFVQTHRVAEATILAAATVIATARVGAMAIKVTLAIPSAVRILVLMGLLWGALWLFWTDPLSNPLMLVVYYVVSALYFMYGFRED